MTGSESEFIPLFLTLRDAKMIAKIVKYAMTRFSSLHLDTTFSALILARFQFLIQIT